MRFRRILSVLATSGLVCSGPVFATPADERHIEELGVKRSNREGIAYCQKVLAREPNNWYVMMYDALFRFWSGDFVSGEREMNRVVQLAPRQAQPRTHLANMLMHRGKESAALDMAQAAAAVDQTDGAPHMILAVIYLKRHQYENALAEAEKVQKARTRTDVGVASAVKLTCLVALGRMAQAREYAAEIDLSKVDWRAADPVANELLRRGFIQRGLMLANWSAQYTHSEASYYLLSYGYATLNKVAEAEKAAKQLWKLNPHNVHGRIVMCRMYIDNGMYKDAEDCLKAIPDSPTANHHRSVCALTYRLHREQQKYEEALKDLDRLIALSNPIDKVAWIAKRGEVYLLLGETTRALAEYSRAIKADPANGEWYRKRADVYEEMNDVKAAAADRQKAGSLR